MNTRPNCNENLEGNSLESTKYEVVKNTKKCHFCAEEILEEATECNFCLENLWEYQEKNSLVEEAENDNKEGLKGLWGWLYLVIIGLLITPFMLLSQIDYIFISLINDWTLSQIISPESSTYIKWFYWIFLIELIINIIFILFTSFLIHLFFMRSKLFPRMYQIFLFSYLLFLALDFYFTDYIVWDTILEDSEPPTEVYKSLVTFIVWWSYMQVSERVKNTFTIEWFKEKNIYVVVYLIFIGITFISTLSWIDISKLTFNEYEYWNETCLETYWKDSYYMWEYDDGWYICNCKEWYEFGWENKDTCISIK